MKPHRAQLPALALLVVASACGGGGGGGGSSTVPPSNLVYSDADVGGLSGVEFGPLVPSVDGEVDHFSIVPPLPAGLVLDTVTGMIAGTPLAPSPRALYDVAATNSGGSVHFQVALRVAATPRFAFLAGGEDATLQTFLTDATDGRLTRRGYAHVASLEDLQEVVVDPLGRFVYATEAAATTIAAFAIDPESGAVTLAGEVEVGLGPHAIAIDPSGRFAYVSSRTSDRLDGFAIDQDTGALTPNQAVITTSDEPSRLAIDPRGEFLFGTTAGSNPEGLASSLYVLRIDPATGVLLGAAAPQKLNGGRPEGIVVDPTRDVVYLTLDAFDGVLPVRFSRPLGTLTPVGLRATGVGPRDVVVDPEGRRLFVACEKASIVDTFDIQPTNASLSHDVATPVAGGPRGLALDPIGAVLHVTTHTDPAAQRFAVDAQDGTLALEESLALRGASGALAFAVGDAPIEWLPRFVHVANSGSDDVSAYRIDPQTGELVASNAPFVAGGAPVALAVHQNLRFAWIASAISRELWCAAVDPSTGALSQAAPPVSLEGEPTHVALDPSGRFLYLASSEPDVVGDGWISTFAIDAETGAAALVDHTPVGAHPSSVVVDPTGRFVFVAERGDGAPGAGSITSLSIAVTNGIPSASGGSVLSTSVESLSTHPNGRFLYAMSQATGDVGVFAIDRTNGALSVAPPGSNVGLQPSVVCVSPDGRFAYGAIQGGGNVALFAVGADGQLSEPIQEIALGASPVDVSLEPSGRFLYVANRDADQVSAFSIDVETGVLTALGDLPCGMEPSAIAASASTR